ncbi:MAG: MFS transporter [Candidatus Omnitrophica bacterium]|nr:MFS transporter [Candidatus Omnitrophota bacterium]
MIRMLTDKNNGNFFRLWLGQLVSQFGDRITQLALVGLAAEKMHGAASATGLAKLMAFTILPVFLIQPIAGVLVDRWDRRTTLFVCDIVRSLLILSIPFIFMRWHTMLPIYGVIFLTFCFSRFYVPAKMSIIPDLVEDDNLLAANSLVSTTGMIAFVLGCAVGGVLIEWFGARTGFIIDAATFFISGVMIYSITVRRDLVKTQQEFWVTGKELVGKIKVGFWEDLRDGIKYLMTHKEIRFIIDMLFAILFMAGSVYVVIIVFIQQSFGSVTKHLGGLAVCLGAGLFLGALAYGKWGKKLVWYKTIFASFISAGIMLIIFAYLVKLYPNVWLAGALASLLGLFIGPIFIATNTVAQVVSDEKMRGKVFSALEIVIHLAFLLSMLLSSWASKYVGTQHILITAGSITCLIGVVGLFRGEFKAKERMIQ